MYNQVRLLCGFLRTPFWIFRSFHGSLYTWMLEKNKQLFCEDPHIWRNFRFFLHFDDIWTNYAYLKHRITEKTHWVQCYIVSCKIYVSLISVFIFHIFLITFRSCRPKSFCSLKKSAHLYTFFIPLVFSY